MIAMCSGNEVAVRSTRPIVNAGSRAHAAGSRWSVDQHRGFRQRYQRLVKGDVGVRIFVDVILRQPVLAEFLEKSRSAEMSFLRAMVVISRAAMLSSAAQARIMSTISLLVGGPR